MKVNEIFVSIQGEGPEAGRRAICVRFSGCNLNCSWCDSKYALHTYLDVSVAQVMDTIYKSKIQYVVLTGGEPTIQEAFSFLLDALEHEGFKVDVETNGVRMPDRVRSNIRYIVSPKDRDVALNWKLYGITHMNEETNFVFKFVVDVDTMDETFQFVKDHCDNPVWFMPKTMNIKGNTECMVKEIVETGRIIMSEMIKQGIDGYLCTRLQNLYRVR